MKITYLYRDVKVAGQFLIKFTVLDFIRSASSVLELLRTCGQPDESAYRTNKLGSVSIGLDISVWQSH